MNSSCSGSWRTYRFWRDQEGTTEEGTPIIWSPALIAFFNDSWMRFHRFNWAHSVHLEYCYQQQGLPRDWAITTSDNGWTNDALGLYFINHFDKRTKHCTTDIYRLLILDGHSSYATPEFDTYCLENNIITECLPSHTSHILQLLDVVCFSPLKTAYGHPVQNLARQAIFHVDKADFLMMYQQARTTIHSKQNILSGFHSRGSCLTRSVCMTLPQECHRRCQLPKESEACMSLQCWISQCGRRGHGGSTMRPTRTDARQWSWYESWHTDWGAGWTIERFTIISWIHV